MTAREILNRKGRKVFSITDNATVSEAVLELVNNKIGLLIVKTTSGTIAGVISERDIIRKCIHPKKDPTQIRAGDIMTPRENIVAASEGDDTQSLINTMTQKKIRHLPIFKGTELSGVISIGDIIKNMLEIKDYEIKTLLDYISGKYPG